MGSPSEIAIELVRATGTGETHAERIVMAYRQGMTVLDVLRQVYREIDPSLAFRHSCDIGVCCCCLATVDGRAVLICREPARDGMVVEAPKGFRILRDLVVDPSERISGPLCSKYQGPSFKPRT